MSSTEAQNENCDPALVSLFAHSLGAVKIPAKPASWPDSHPMTTSAVEASNSPSNADREQSGLLSATSLEQVHNNLPLGHDISKSSSRNRKRKDAEDDLEGRYMRQLARKEFKEDQNRVRNKRQKTKTHRDLNAHIGSLFEGCESTSEPNIVTGVEEEFAVRDVPRHESLVMSRADSDLEKSSRTVFLANVSTMAIKSKRAKKALMDHLASFTSSLPADKGGLDIESLRFRSTAFADSGIPKKAAFVRKEIMDTTTKSTNAYVVYTTQLAAREAVKRLNGSIVLDRHLRVDSVAHPKKIDHRRCVFVGNLAFVDDETNVKAAQNEDINKRPRKAKEPADVEEGLWRQFEKAGIVESVRVVRDKTTRVGKGFAYVQFEDVNSVEKALLYHEKKFPPMLPRALRVTRARNTKNAANRKEGPPTKSKVPSVVPSLTGRAHKLLGRAGAAQLRATGRQHRSSSKSVKGAGSTTSLLFEGFRASSSPGKVTLKTAGRKRSKRLDRSKEFRTKGRTKTKL